MSQTLIVASLIVGSVLAAWLRFDAMWSMVGRLVALLCLAAAFAALMIRGRRLSPTQLPLTVEELGARETLTPDQEAQFADALRAWHGRQQRQAWEDIARGGPVPLMGARTALYYLWLSFLAVALLPPGAVPTSVLPELPRFLVVLLPVAAVSLVVAAPLAIRDWQRAVRALARGEAPTTSTR